MIPSLQLKSALLKDKQINDFVILFQLVNTFILSSFLQTNLSESEKLGLLRFPAFEFLYRCGLIAEFCFLRRDYANFCNFSFRVGQLNI